MPTSLTDLVLGTPVQFDCYMKYYRPQEYYSDSRWKGTQALDGGGALINQGILGLDLLLHLTSDEVVSVMARTAVRAHTDIEVEDTCAAVLVFRSGALGVLQATTSINPDRQCRLVRKPRRPFYSCSQMNASFSCEAIIGHDRLGTHIMKSHGKI